MDSQKVENVHAVTQTIMQAAIEAVEAATEAMSEAASPTERRNAAVTVLNKSARNSRPALKQPTYNWNAQAKYN